MAVSEARQRPHFGNAELFWPTAEPAVKMRRARKEVLAGENAVEAACWVADPVIDAHIRSILIVDGVHVRGQSLGREDGC